MDDLNFQAKLIKKIEAELHSKITDTISPPQGMGSTVFLIQTNDGIQYAVKYGSTVTNDVAVLELISKSNIDMPVPKMFGNFVFEKIPVLILERIQYPLLDSIPVAQMDKYIPSMVKHLRELHKITSNKPGCIKDQGHTDTWKDIMLSKFDGRTAHLQWDEIATRQGLNKDVVLTSVEKILHRIEHAEFTNNYSLLHTDFNQRNLFVNPQTDEITGIIDWSEAIYGDPIYDFARVRMYIWHFNLKPETLENYYNLLNLNPEERNTEKIYMLVRIIEYLAYYSEDLNKFNIGRIKLHQDFLRKNI